MLKDGDDLSFTKYFWKGCEPTDNDPPQYHKFATALKLAHQGVENPLIAVRVGVSPTTIISWISGEKAPKLVHYLRAYLRMGDPAAGAVWLSVETSHGHAIPIGTFIQVPLIVKSWAEIGSVIRQLQPLQDVRTGLDRRYLFGFLLGMLIGDSDKSHQGRSHRHLALVLSMRYDTNLKLGEFMCQCAQSFGLRMQRSKDLPRPEKKPHGFYQWTSQSSPLIDWIFNVALGLRDEQTTTYDAIKADWAIEAPLEFRIGLLQGLAESDGSVNVSGQELEFWIGPNWSFMTALLASLGLCSFRSREAVSLSKSQAVKAFFIPAFSPILKTVRYQRLDRLAKGTKPSQGGGRLSEEIRAEIGELKSSGFSASRIIRTILDRHGLLLSFEAVHRWASRPSDEVAG
ncbi:MAG: hypothetical protein HYW93_01410 [Thaumarchaeota archaeon]|nr:hypothetical protein [Nitrososphaerota archaeon]